jgi:chromosome segregation ATPase
MDSIKSKIQSLANETRNALKRYDDKEKEVADINANADQLEEQVKILQKKEQNIESKLDASTEELFNHTTKMEIMEKKAGNTECQVGDLTRKLLLMEENAIRSEERLASSVTNLAKTSFMADDSLKKQNDMVNMSAKQSEINDGLERQLKDAQFTRTDSENKFELLAQKLKIKEEEAGRSKERLEGVECKFMDIEDELKLVGQNQQILEVLEEKFLEREEELQKQIKELITKLGSANARSENAEMDIGRLNIRFDKVEEDLIVEKTKIQKVSDELNKCFDNMMGL